VYFDVSGPGKLDWRPATCPICGYLQLFHKLFRIPKEECDWRLPRTPLYLLEGCSKMIQDNKIFNNTIRRRYEARKQLEAARRAQYKEVKVNQHWKDAQEDKVRGTRNLEVIDKGSQEANQKPEDKVIILEQIVADMKPTKKKIEEKKSTKSTKPTVTEIIEDDHLVEINEDKQDVNRSTKYLRKGIIRLPMPRSGEVDTEQAQKTMTVSNEEEEEVTTKVHKVKSQPKRRREPMPTEEDVRRQRHRAGEGSGEAEENSKQGGKEVERSDGEEGREG
jgi:hypothetical protein